MSIIFSLLDILHANSQEDSHILGMIQISAGNSQEDFPAFGDDSSF